jgi:SpoIIAA-like
MGVEHLRSWKRIALVTDIDWMTHLTSLFGRMTPGETKSFSLDQEDEATRWVAEQ